MHKTLSLSEYVKRRNGVAMGAKYSMRNMLFRSFGASSFAIFWHYWNPIWGYYLSRYVMDPIRLTLPRWCAVICTFSVSGFLHDFAVSLVKWQIIFIFTPWFAAMGLIVVITEYCRFSYRSVPWLVRALINILIIVSSFCFIKMIDDYHFLNLM